MIKLCTRNGASFQQFFDNQRPWRSKGGNQKANVEPESCLRPTDKVKFFFCFKAPNVTAIYMLTGEINERKACRLDKILCKLLKLASGIVGASLSSIFKIPVETGLCRAKLEGG